MWEWDNGLSGASDVHHPQSGLAHKRKKKRKTLERPLGERKDALK